jgi:hypothetical protein
MINSPVPCFNSHLAIAGGLVSPGQNFTLDEYGFLGVGAGLTAVDFGYENRVDPSADEQCSFQLWVASAGSARSYCKPNWQDKQGRLQCNSAKNNTLAYFRRTQAVENDKGGFNTKSIYNGRNIQHITELGDVLVVVNNSIRATSVSSGSAPLLEVDSTSSTSLAATPVATPPPSPNSGSNNIGLIVGGGQDVPGPSPRMRACRLAGGPCAAPARPPSPPH